MRARSCSVFSCQFPRTDPPALLHHWQSVCHCQNWFFLEFPISEKSRLTGPLPLLPNLVSRLGRPQPILTTSTITRQCFCFPQGVNSMKSIIRYSNGPAGAGWDAKGVFIPLATLCVLQVTHLLQKISANTVNPFVNHNSFICIIILPFDTWSNPCVNLA